MRHVLLILARSYATGDLEGLKVAHDFEELGEGEDRILTLKDSRILDNEGMSYFTFFVVAH